MQPTPDPFQVQRRTLDIEDYIDVLRRHKSWIVGPAFAGLVIAVVAAFLIPDAFVSEAVIRVEQPTLSPGVIPQIVISQMNQRINTTAQTVLSRARLTDVINTFKLYQAELKSEPLDDIFERMRTRDIRISPVGTIAVSERAGLGGSIPAFRVSFKYRDRFVAQKVAEQIASEFINDSLRNETQENTQAMKLLQDQKETARLRLQKADADLAEYRTQHQATLPESINANQQQLYMLQSRVDSANATLNRDLQSKLSIDSQIKIIQNRKRDLRPPSEDLLPAPRNDQLGALDRQIADTEVNIAALRERYSDRHPAVQQAIGALGVLKRRRDVVAQEEPSKRDITPVMNQMMRQYEMQQKDLDAEIQRLENQLEILKNEQDNAQRALEAAQSEMRTYQARLASMPGFEGKYVELLREQGLAKEAFEDTNRKLTAAESQQTVIKQAMGERLSLLEPAYLPTTAAEPKRPQIIGAGAGLGLLIGLVLAGAREVKDTSLKNLKDVRAYTQLNVLGSIPLLENDLIVRRRRRVAWLAWTTACILGVIVMTGTIFHYYATKV